MQLWKATANQAHPFSKFATGNYATLMTTPTVRQTQYCMLLGERTQD